MLSPIPSVLDYSSTFLLVSWALGSALFLSGPPPQGARGGSLESKPDFPCTSTPNTRSPRPVISGSSHPPPSPHFPSKRSLLHIHHNDCLPLFIGCFLSLRLTHCLPSQMSSLAAGEMAHQARPWLIRLDHSPRKHWAWLKLHAITQDKS